VLYDAGALHGLYETYALNPVLYPQEVQGRGTPSDQAMLNHYIGHLDEFDRLPHWTERNGFVTYFGKGYEKFQRLGVGPGQPHLPPGARIVVLGSADKAVMDEGRYPWIREHWNSLGEKVRA